MPLATHTSTGGAANQLSIHLFVVPMSLYRIVEMDTLPCHKITRKRGEETSAVRYFVKEPWYVAQMLSIVIVMLLAR
jgi:hypothetical protein